MAEKGTYVTSVKTRCKSKVVKLIKCHDTCRSGFSSYLSLANMEGTIYGNRLPMGYGSGQKERLGTAGIGCFTCIIISSLVCRTVGRVRNM